MLSSRARYMRNVRGYPFPHACSEAQLASVQALLSGAARSSGIIFDAYRQMSAAERHYLIGTRLMSPEFDSGLPGRMLLLDESRTVSLMINEEDHLRLQSLTGGLSLWQADGIANDALASLGRSLEWAQSHRHGYLAASPFNSGQGRRLSVLLHLIGLAHAKRLPKVLQMLTVENLSARGLFGESSRAIGAFVQVSFTRGAQEAFTGAIDYLLDAERQARREIGLDAMLGQAATAAKFAETSSALTLADSLRVLAWARWASAEKAEGWPTSVREVDRLLSELELRASADEAKMAQHRARLLRQILPTGG